MKAEWHCSIRVWSSSCGVTEVPLGPLYHCLLGVQFVQHKNPRRPSLHALYAWFEKAEVRQ